MGDLSLEGLDALLDEHAKCQDVVYYFQRHVTGKPISMETRSIIRHYAQACRIISNLKRRGKCVTR